MKYRPEIDGLRGLAVLPVILFHAGFELFGGGFIGVDVFFVISGYLITTILIQDIEDKNFSLINFYERRARRILPALFFVMLICIPFAWIWMLPSQMKDFSESLIAVSLFASNILFWRESGYFGAAAEEKPLLHTWSLAVEEQFYLLFPIFLILTWRFGRNKVFWAIVFMAAISLIISEWGWRNKATANFYLAPTRAWELFAGSIAAFVVQKKGVEKNNTLALFGLAAIVFSMFLYSETTPFPSVYAAIPVFGAVLFIMFADEDTLAAKILSTKVFVGIGLISYSAYLWHQPLLAFSRLRSFNEPSSLLLFVLIACSLGLAYLSWKYIEIPFRKKARIGRLKIFLFSLLGLALFSVFGFIGHKSNGFFEYITTQHERTILGSAIASPKRQECHTGGAEYLTYDESCEYFAENVTMAVYGDSHTVEFAYALAEELQGSGQGVKHLSFSGCVPTYKIEMDMLEFSKISDVKNCASWTSQTIDGLISDSRIETVIISFKMSYALYGNYKDHYPRLLDERGNETRRAIWNSLIHLIETLEKSGKKTVFLQQAPELPQLVGSLISNDDGTSAPGVSRSWWNRRVAFMYENIEDLERLTEVIDLAEIFCDDQVCYAVKDNEALYFDDNHMSLVGARRAAKQVIPIILSSENIK